MPRDSELLTPACIPDRIAARCHDFRRMGVAFVIGLAPFMFGVWGSEAIGGGFDFEETAHLLAFAIVVALGYELTVLARRGKTLGKQNKGIEVRNAAQFRLRASRRRTVCRYLMTVAACLATFTVVFVMALVLGASPTLWTVCGLVVVSVAAVWLTVLVSALLRSDRRGWHDVVAGTVLVHAADTARPATLGKRTT